jgi:hypothetical protein
MKKISNDMHMIHGGKVSTATVELMVLSEQSDSIYINDSCLTHCGNGKFTLGNEEFQDFHSFSYENMNSRIEWEIGYDDGAIYAAVITYDLNSDISKYLH